MSIPLSIPMGGWLMVFFHREICASGINIDMRSIQQLLQQILLSTNDVVLNNIVSQVNFLYSTNHCYCLIFSFLVVVDEHHLRVDLKVQYYFILSFFLVLFIKHLISTFKTSTPIHTQPGLAHIAGITTGHYTHSRDWQTTAGIGNDYRRDW